MNNTNDYLSHDLADDLAYLVSVGTYTQEQADSILESSYGYVKLSTDWQYDRAYTESVVNHPYG